MAIKSTLVVSVALLADIACAHASGCYQYRPLRGHAADDGSAITACMSETSGFGFSGSDWRAMSKAMDACMLRHGFRSVRISPVDCPAPPD